MRLLLLLFGTDNILIGILCIIINVSCFRYGVVMFSWNTALSSREEWKILIPSENVSLPVPSDQKIHSQIQGKDNT